MKHRYVINGIDFDVDLESEIKYCFGQVEVLSSKFGDLTAGQVWFDDGYTVLNAKPFYDFSSLYLATYQFIKSLLVELNPSHNFDDFQLENYHEHVSFEDHTKVVKRCRRLFPNDLGVDIDSIVNNFGTYLGSDLTFFNPITKENQWMIARINRPRSINYNPVHKDIYELYDNYENVPKMVNIWIPICGVDKNSSLPVVPSSHLLPENVIKRTKAGSRMNGNNYSVASAMEWDGRIGLTSPVPRKGEFLMFSSHLLHGLGFNANNNTTRISFEFRLYQKT